jgi:hypothetical protein
LPKAAPALLRHLAAYVDLASLDLARSQREIASELMASAVVVICALFAVLMGCLAVVAYTWDTPYRLTAIEADSSWPPSSQPSIAHGRPRGDRSSLPRCGANGRKTECCSNAFCHRIRTDMTDRNDAAEAEILARLAASREEVRRVLDPPRREPAEGSPPREPGVAGFPRSRTMQMLMGGRGLGVLGALAGGLFIARPGVALRLLRMLPASTVARMLLAKGLGALRDGKNHRGDSPR